MGGGHGRTVTCCGRRPVATPALRLSGRAGRPGHVQPRDRRAALPQPEDHRIPPLQGVSEVGSPVPQGPGHSRPARSVRQVLAGGGAQVQRRPRGLLRLADPHLTHSEPSRGATLRPDGSSAPESSKRTTPLQSRLHPCSGCADFTRAAPRAGESADGHIGRCPHMISTSRSTDGSDARTAGRSANLSWIGISPVGCQSSRSRTAAPRTPPSPVSPSRRPRSRPAPSRGAAGGSR